MIWNKHINFTNPGSKKEIAQSLMSPLQDNKIEMI